MADDLNSILADNADLIDSIISELASGLDRVVGAAQNAVVLRLLKELSITGSRVESSAANQRVLSRVGDMFLQELEAAGYSEVIKSYVDTFDGQFTSFQTVLDHISSELLHPLPKVTFSPGNMAEFAARKIGTEDLIKDVAGRVASVAKQQAMLYAGGLPAKELKTLFSKQFGKTVAESKTLADTSITEFYRSITDRGYKIIEQDLPDFEIRYNYEGPLDKLNRPFCSKLEKLSRAGKTWLRKEIDKLTNGQISNVFISCGGFNCRHQWVIAISNLREQQRRKGPQKELAAHAPNREDVRREIEARKKISQRSVKTMQPPHDQIRAIREAAMASVKGLRASG